MKFKTQENENPKNSPFFEDVTHLIEVCLQFKYAVKSYVNFVKNPFEFNSYNIRLDSDYELLQKLAIALNSDHINPTINVELVAATSVDDLIKLEEKYYNMLKEIGNNALEQNDAEVFSYISKLIRKFEHYFCTLNESNDKGEASS